MLFRSFGTRQDSFPVLARIPLSPDTPPDSITLRYSHRLYHFSILVRIVFRTRTDSIIFRYSIDSTIFRYSSGQFSGTRRDSTFSRYSPGFNKFCGTHTDYIIFRYSSGQFSGTRTDSSFSRYSPGSIIFRYSHRFYHFSVLVRTVFRYSHGFHFFPILSRIQ